jgi:hypothetical protein
MESIGKAQFGDVANMSPEPAPPQHPKYKLACLRRDWSSDPDFVIRCPKCDGSSMRRRR